MTRSTTVPTRDDIERYILQTLQELARDWDYSRPLDGNTRLFCDLGFESLDAVVLGSAIQDHYRRAMPFAEMLVELGQTQTDLTINGLVAFVQQHVAAPALEA